MDTVHACKALDLRIKAEAKGVVRLYMRRMAHAIEWAATYRVQGALDDARRCIEDAKAAYSHILFLTK